MSDLGTVSWAGWLLIEQIEDGRLRRMFGLPVEAPRALSPADLEAARREILERGLAYEERGKLRLTEAGASFTILGHYPRRAEPRAEFDRRPAEA